jgi:hypothetical protein
MLTKTLKFDDDVLDVFRSMEWSDDGTLGLIIGGQLERNLYQRCNKAYDALGGKWDRRAGGIVFKTDPRPQIEGLIIGGQLQVERDGFFETPRAVAERMLELVPLPWNNKEAYLLEPSAGLGAIVDVITINHHFPKDDILCMEKNAQRAEALNVKGYKVSCCNFLEWEQARRFHRIYMNPPFEELQDIDHVKHAYDLLANGGKMISVMAESAFFRSDKKSVEFRDWLFFVNAYSEKLPEGSFKESGTGVNARLVVIEK